MEKQVQWLNIYIMKGEEESATHVVYNANITCHDLSKRKASTTKFEKISTSL